MQELDSVRINFDNSTMLIMNISLGLVMFGVALGLSIEDFKRLIQMPKLVLVGFFSQFFALPLVTYIFVWIIQPMPSVALGLFLIAACPGGNISNFISSYSKANVALSITLTAIATSIAAFLVPVNFWVWASLYPETVPLLKEVDVSFLDLLEVVIMLLGLPLVIGLIFRYKLPNLTQKLLKPIQTLSLLIFATFIIFALLKNGEYFMQYIGVIFLIVLAHNGLALLTGYSIGHLFKFDEASKRTLTIETGIQNAGLGLVIVLGFFSELGGMAVITAWWGIWDMIAGLMLGFFWSRR